MHDDVAGQTNLRIKSHIGRGHICPYVGYDQTNRDIIIITGFSKTGKTAICRRARRIPIRDANAHFTENSFLAGEGYGDFFRMEIRETSRGKYSLIGQYPFSDGIMNRGTMSGYFSPVAKNEILHGTDIRYGH